MYILSHCYYNDSIERKHTFKYQKVDKYNTANTLLLMNSVQSVWSPLKRQSSVWVQFDNMTLYTKNQYLQTKMNTSWCIRSLLTTTVDQDLYLKLPMNIALILDVWFSQQHLFCLSSKLKTKYFF